LNWQGNVATVGRRHRREGRCRSRHRC